jgi:hypothetical protein
VLSLRLHNLASVGTLVLALVALSGCDKFKRKHIPVEALPELAYPSCEHASGSSVELAHESLRAGRTHHDKNIVERFTIAQRDCLTVFTMRQEWPLGTTDLEVVYDAELKPLRIWKRQVTPTQPNAPAKEELRRYELRSRPAGIKRRAPGGTLHYEQLLGDEPLAVVGPGRGNISMWLRRAKLKPGEKVRHAVIDVRALEKIEPVTLMREPDMDHPELGHVRVYTFFGRETVFANEEDVVIGDLMGMRPAAKVDLPEPPAIPSPSPIDPIHTP